MCFVWKEPKEYLISDEMGVAPIYVEPIMEQLLKVKLVVPYNKKKVYFKFWVCVPKAGIHAGTVSCEL